MEYITRIVDDEITKIKALWCIEYYWSFLIEIHEINNMENKINFKDLNKKDYSTVIDLAITGMHFDWYLDSKFLQRLYGRYFLYMELNRATRIISAYNGEEFLGLLLAEIDNEEVVHKSFIERVYVKIFDIIQDLFFKGVDVYNQANIKMLVKLKRKYHTDGEIIFLSANPNSEIKGIGTLLLNELIRLEKGKRVYLYTDNACTYQFYEHRDFEKVAEENIKLTITNKKVDLTCFLYSRVL